MTKPHTTYQHILECAHALFYEHGYRATGVEAVAEACGITKATLYHHFKNKAALVQAVLTYAHDMYTAECKTLWDSIPSPEKKLVALFDAMAEFFIQPDCFGCPFINAAAEYSDPNSEERKICASYFAFIQDHMEQYAKQAKLSQPKRIAEQLVGLITGAYSSWHVARNKHAAQNAKSAALLLIESAK